MSTTSTTEYRLQGLRRIAPEKIVIGKPLPGSLHTARGRRLIRRGHVIQQDDLDLINDHIARGIYGDSDWSADYDYVENSVPTSGTRPPISVEKTAIARQQPSPVEMTIESPPPGLSSSDSPSPLYGPGDEMPCALMETEDMDLVPVSLDKFYVSKKLTHPVYSASGVLLLAAGIEVTHVFLSRLRQQGVREVRISRHAPEADDAGSAMFAQLTGELDSYILRMRKVEQSLGRRSSPVRQMSLKNLRELTERGQEAFCRSIERVADISTDIVNGHCSSVGAARDLVEQFMRMVDLDSSLLPAIVAMRSVPGEYLYKHGLSVALLSMAAAERLGIRRENVLQIGLGALLQDVGMLDVPEELRLAPRGLTPAEREEVARHPLYSLERLQHVEGLSEVALVICYQSHECVNGTGYPRRRTGDMIHPYARLVAAADAYAAICSNRPYRDAHSPYHAMQAILRQASRDVFDREVVRHLLDCISLFPIGSYVRLSNGATGKVIRANARFHTKPVIVLLNSDGSETDDELDLTKSGDLQVVQALPGLPSGLNGASGGGNW
jgi:HD-GYP domain-containing protein (c-di-GMP phosphodiesterase class II)